MCILCEKAEFLIETMESIWSHENITEIAQTVYKNAGQEVMNRVNSGDETIIAAVRMHIFMIAATRFSVKMKITPEVTLTIFKEHLMHQVQKSLLEDLSTEEGQERILKGMFKRIFGIDID